MSGAYREQHYRIEAPFYDAIYAQRRDVAEEVAALDPVLADVGVTAPTSLLDVACGTGVHLAVWCDRGLDVAGVDVSPDMLEVARRRLPDHVPLTRADFRDFDLGRTFDVVTCMFSSIGHAGRDGLDAAVAAMARHVAPGGALIIEPWLTPDRVRGDGKRDVVCAVVGDRAVSRVARSWVEDGDLVVHFGWTVASREAITHETDTVAMPLLDQARYLEAVARAGLAASWVDEHGWGERRGLLVGARPAV